MFPSQAFEAGTGGGSRSLGHRPFSLHITPSFPPSSRLALDGSPAHVILPQFLRVGGWEKLQKPGPPIGSTATKSRGHGASLRAGALLPGGPHQTRPLLPGLREAPSYLTFPSLPSPWAHALLSGPSPLPSLCIRSQISFPPSPSGRLCKPPSRTPLSAVGTGVLRV